MKQLLILSGKGGTGKTTTSAAFIQFAKAKAFADCDVDAPNLHLVSNRKDEVNHSDYYGSKKAVLDENKCILCGKCLAHCRFHAVKQVDRQFQIDEYACEGCGVCEYVCPQQAITLQEDIAGRLTLYQGESVFSTAKLKMGRGNSGKLVSEVKTALRKATGTQPLAIIDGSPGIGCPVIASINGVDLVLLVTEPSLSGISDMERIVKTAKMLQATVAVCVNKYDTSLEHTRKIETYCKEHEIPFVGRIPYDKQASNAINQGMSLAEIDCPARDALKVAFDRTINLLHI